MKHLSLLVVLAVIAMAILAGCGGTAPSNPNEGKLEIWQMDCDIAWPPRMIEQDPNNAWSLIRTEFRLPGSTEGVPVTATSDKGGTISMRVGQPFTEIQALQCPWRIESTKEGWTISIAKISRPPCVEPMTTEQLIGGSWVNTTRVKPGVATRWVGKQGVFGMAEFIGPGPQPITDGEAWYFSPDSVGYWTAVSDPGVETAFEVVR